MIVARLINPFTYRREPTFPLRHGRRSAESKHDLPARVQTGGSHVALHGGVHSAGQGVKCGQTHSPLQAATTDRGFGSGPFSRVPQRLADLICPHHDTENRP